MKANLDKGVSREEALQNMVAQAKVQKAKKKKNKKTTEATPSMFALGCGVCVFVNSVAWHMKKFYFLLL